MMEKTASPRTWVVVLNYRGREHLQVCLTSLEKQTFPPGGAKVLVVDNASTDDSVEIIRREFPQVELITSETNLGFTGGNNLGLRRAIEAGAEFIALLNMDIRVDPGWLTALVECAEAHGDAALLGSRILTSDGALVEFDGGQFDPVTTSGGYANYPATESGPPTRPCAYACGAALLARSSALREVGLFDETFFAYHEDVELSLRCWLRGYSVLNVAESVVYHAGGGAGGGAGFRDFMGARNSILALLKLYDRSSWQKHAATLVGHFLSRDRPDRVGALLSASFRLPVALARRRLHRSQSPRLYGELVQLLRKS